MILKYYNNILLVKKYWSIIEDKNSNVYQTYEFNKILCYIRKTSINNIINRSTKDVFVVAFEKNKPCCIAPLIIDEKNKVIRILGYGTNVSYLNFIYNTNLEKKIIFEFFIMICKKYNKYKFEITDIPSDSEILNVFDLTKCKFKKCYAINIGDSYESYYNSLSKSTRQNIRTVYNRLLKDGYSYNVKVYDDVNLIGNELLKKINYIYHKRRLEWFELETNKLNSFNKIQEIKEMKRDLIFRSIKRISNTNVIVLEINNEPTAFMIGYKGSNRMTVPRLAIDTKYSRYSPGGLLLIEYIKSLFNDGCNNYTIDLSRGDEKYKAVYGGVESYTYSIDFYGNEFMNYIKKGMI